MADFRCCRCIYNSDDVGIDVDVGDPGRSPIDKGGE